MKNTLKKHEFKQIIESMPNALIVSDESGKIIMANKKMEELFGYTKDELYKSTVDLLIPKLYSKQHPEHIKSFVFKPSHRSMGENRDLFGLKKNGVEFPLEIGLNPIKINNNNNNNILVITTIVDITKRKALELKIQSALDLLKFNNEEKTKRADELVIANKELVFQNEEKTKRAEELVIANKELVFQKEEKTKRADELVIANKELVFQKEEKTKRAEELVIANKELVFQKEEKTKRAEELVIANKELVFQKEELKEFAYITSHDLQEPLRTISSFTKLINDEHKDELSEDLKTYINFLSESSDRLRNLITNLLDYTRLGNLKTPTLVDCNVLIKEILTDLNVSISESKSKISLVDPLPTITGSKSGLRILFQNLISNAIKFSKKDTLPQIKIFFKEDSEKWLFYIQDNGIGMKKKDLKKIFGFFTRLHNRDSYEGTGIGLAYCIKVVKKHNGNIWVDSELGEGSTFYFTISKTLI
ncbi:PAS domain-containing sensor histidine kinase [Polaribacter sp.]|jgi:PAS domain S-box-containing protein|uniref:PAS domain-containing sensor histidine kinase n=1 Tax=Polaribacter sp. TaxID=1920175 RepID=UPI003EE95CA8